MMLRNVFSIQYPLLRRSVGREFGHLDQDPECPPVALENVLQVTVGVRTCRSDFTRRVTRIVLCYPRNSLSNRWQVTSFPNTLPQLCTKRAASVNRKTQAVVGAFFLSVLFSETDARNCVHAACCPRRRDHGLRIVLVARGPTNYRPRGTNPKYGKSSQRVMSKAEGAGWACVSVPGLGTSGIPWMMAVI